MIRTQVDRAAGVVTHTGTGAISIEEVEAALCARLEDQDFRPGMKVLWDCRDASISSLSAAEMRRLISYHTKHKDDRGGGMTAIVVPRDSDYGTARMLQTYADDLPWETMVFRDLASALMRLGSQ